MTLTSLESQTGILCPLLAVVDELFLQISLMLVSLSNQSLHTCASRVGGGGGGEGEEREVGRKMFFKYFGFLGLLISVFLQSCLTTSNLFLKS